VYLGLHFYEVSACGWPGRVRGDAHESYRPCKKMKKLKSSQGPKKGCRVIDRFAPSRKNCGARETAVPRERL
jgi:hypothetical protein